MSASLGLDIGTSKAAIAVIDSKTKKELFINSCATRAYIQTSTDTHREQSPGKILNIIKELLSSIPTELKAEISCIGLTGQMHGVLLWNSDFETSNLITWEDNRASTSSFLNDLQKKTATSSLKDGYGCTSLAWLSQHQPEIVSKFSCSGTIQDYIQAFLCNSPTGKIDAADAASWGLFDISNNMFDLDKISQAGIPKELMPEVSEMGSKAGKLSKAPASVTGLTEGITIFTATGDNQASLLASIKNPKTEAALTLGTGGQLSVVLSRLPELETLPASVEIRPYFNNSFIAVSACLCGGSAFKWLMDSIKIWLNELGICAPEDDEIYKILNKLALGNPEPSLSVQSSFLGERHNSQLKGSISNITDLNFSLSELSPALMRGILQNLKSMMPPEFLADKKYLSASGNGLRKLPAMQQMAGKVFEKELILREIEEEAAYGAALIPLL